MPLQHGGTGSARGHVRADRLFPERLLGAKLISPMIIFVTAKLSINGKKPANAIHLVKSDFKLQTSWAMHVLIPPFR